MEVNCPLCFHVSSEFLDLGDQPMANKYPLSPTADESYFRTKVYFCSNCKHIHLGILVSRETMFEDYYYLSSVNKALVEHYEAFARDKLKDAKFVVDVGSNDGISLKPLKEMGVKALGVDPSINVGKIANDAGLETLVGFFDATSAAKIRDEYGRPDVITGFSMFSHLQDQHQFIEDVKKLLTPRGKFIVEVEYNVSILLKMAFERFYLDRISYFSVTSFQKLLRKHGMYVQDAELTNIHGGSLRITAQKMGKGENPSPDVKFHIDSEARWLTTERTIYFGAEAKAQVTALKEKLTEYKKKGLRVAGYGAPARVSTITNFGDIGTDLIEFIIDDSPLKQGRYTPGKHIPIYHPKHLLDNKPDVLVVFAHEYFKDIRKSLPSEYKYLFPIPPKEVL